MLTDKEIQNWKDSIDEMTDEELQKFYDTAPRGHPVFDGTNDLCVYIDDRLGENEDV